MAMHHESDERQLVPVEPRSYAPADADTFSDARVELIRNTVAKGAPDEVFRAMIDIARTRNLDPMAKQISVVQFKKGDDYSIVTTIDGYRAIASDHPTFAGKDRPEYGPVVGKTPQFNRDIPEWCSVTVYRLVQGQRMPFTAEVWWEEYYGGNYTWNKMPRSMLAKVAESHALRMAFTRSLSGMYTQEEMDQAAVEVEGRVVSASTGEVRSPRQATQPSAAVEDPDPNRNYGDEGEWKYWSRKLHGEVSRFARDRDPHDIIHAWAVREGYASASHVPPMKLKELADRFRDEPETARVWVQTLTVSASAPAADLSDEEAIEAALASATPTNGQPEPDSVSDADYMAGHGETNAPRPAGLEPTERQRKLIDLLRSQLNLSPEELDHHAVESMGYVVAGLDRKLASEFITDLQRIKQERLEGKSPAGETTA